MTSMIRETNFVVAQFKKMGANPLQAAKEWIKLAVRPAYRYEWYNYLNTPDLG